ncbi:MAG: 50S ribosomal protein L21 [Ktedonobacteraceae bacterium]|nr:50S ribosomal protein L21 [Ktedonobacteraceae bacterium]
MFAVIKSGGRQYKVSVGQTIEVNRLPFEEGEQVRIEEVLLISDSDRAMIGTPFVSNAAVVATAVRHGRGKKEIVFKYKSKKRYRHRRGHRQELTYLSIDDVLADGISLITGKAPEERQAFAEDEMVSPGAETAGETVSRDSDTDSDSLKKTTRRRRTSKIEDTEDSGDTDSTAEEE